MLTLGTVDGLPGYTGAPSITFPDCLTGCPEFNGACDAPPCSITISQGATGHEGTWLFSITVDPSANQPGCTATGEAGLASGCNGPRVWPSVEGITVLGCGGPGQIGLSISQ